MVYGPLTASRQDGRVGVGCIEEISMVLHPLSPADAVPFGDMPLAPFAMTKRTEADLASAMAEHLREARPATRSEALGALRRAFPDSPLTAPVLALAALVRR